jgi:hypothetical protein
MSLPVRPAPAGRASRRHHATDGWGKKNKKISKSEPESELVHSRPRGGALQTDGQQNERPEKTQNKGPAIWKKKPTNDPDRPRLISQRHR